MPLDVLMTAHNKDFLKVPFVLNSAIRNIKDGIGDIYIISNELLPQSIRSQIKTNRAIISLTDKEAVPGVDPSLIRYRPNWILQMIIKMTQEITPNGYLCIDSDIIINRPLSVFEDGKPTFLLGKDQHHEPYFKWSRKFGDIGREYPHSFINEIMYFDRKTLNDIYQSLGLTTMRAVANRIIELTDSTQYPSEYEFFGNFVTKHFPDRYNVREIKTFLSGKSDTYDENEIGRLIQYCAAMDLDVFTIHTWM